MERNIKEQLDPLYKWVAEKSERSKKEAKKERKDEKKIVHRAVEEEKTRGPEGGENIKVSEKIGKSTAPEEREMSTAPENTGTAQEVKAREEAVPKAVDGKEIKATEKGVKRKTPEEALAAIKKARKWTSVAIECCPTQPVVLVQRITTTYFSRDSGDIYEEEVKELYDKA